MECKLHDIYELKTHDVFIGEVVATYADDAVLTDGKVDLAKVRPLLFDMSTLQYWSIGRQWASAGTSESNTSHRNTTDSVGRIWISSCLHKPSYG
jgi:hypothetical protein